MQYFLYSIVIFRLFFYSYIQSIFKLDIQNFVLEIEETNVKQTN